MQCLWALKLERPGLSNLVAHRARDPRRVSVADEKEWLRAIIRKTRHAAPLWGMWVQIPPPAPIEFVPGGQDLNHSRYRGDVLRPCYVDWIDILFRLNHTSPWAIMTSNRHRPQNTRPLWEGRRVTYSIASYQLGRIVKESFPKLNLFFTLLVS